MSFALKNRKSTPYQNRIKPQLVENTENRMETREPKEACFRLHTQEVRGSSPCAPTIPFNELQATTSEELVSFSVNCLGI